MNRDLDEIFFMVIRIVPSPEVEGCLE